MVEYVTGFMFSKDLRHVALIKKLSPYWQQGKLNGIGGKVEKEETAIVAMTREFKEEAGLSTETKDWKLFCILERKDEYSVNFFYSICNDIYNVRTIEKEEVHIYNISSLPKHCIWNLHWLIPLALDRRISTSFPLLITE